MDQYSNNHGFLDYKSQEIRAPEKQSNFAKTTIKF